MPTNTPSARAASSAPRHVARGRRVAHVSRLLQPACGYWRPGRSSTPSATGTICFSSRTPTTSSAGIPACRCRRPIASAAASMSGGNYTLSRTWGNFDGETAGSGPSVAQVNAYPEYKRPEWNSPEGDLAADQRHRARRMGHICGHRCRDGAGSVTFGLLQQIGSGVPYGAVAPLTAIRPLACRILVTSDAAGAERYHRLLLHGPRCVPHRDHISERTCPSTMGAVSARARAAGAVLSRRSAQHLQPVPAVRMRRLCVQQRRLGRHVDARHGCANAADDPRGGPIRRSIRLRQFPCEARTGISPPPPAPSSAAPLSHLAYTTPRLFRFSVGIRF